MEIFTSADILNSYVESYEFGILFREDSAAVPVSGNVNIPCASAPDMLINAAYSGSNTMGIFNSQPDINISIQLRGICLFVLLTLPEKIVVPTFLCKTADDIVTLFPKAAKVSADTGSPVVLVLSALSLNNYTYKQPLSYTTDRIAPYLGKMLNRGSENYTEKLIASYKNLIANEELEPLTENMSLKIPKADFFKFVFPVHIAEQQRYFSSVSSVNTTPEEKEFLYYAFNVIERMSMSIETTLHENAPVTEIFMCPGCPVACLYAQNNLMGKMVYSSINCPAIKRHYGIINTTYSGYLGLVNKKSNVETLFIGNLSEIFPVNGDLLAFARVVALNDTGSPQPIFPQSKTPEKAVIKENITFPYSCGNIKTYKTVDLRKAPKGAGRPQYVKDSACPAIIRKADQFDADAKKCTGCRRCITYSSRG